MAYQLSIKIWKDFDTESHMRASRDSVVAKAKQAGYSTLVTVSE